MGRVSSLVTSDKTLRHDGEGLPSSLCPINSNRCDWEGETLLIVWNDTPLSHVSEGGVE